MLARVEAIAAIVNGRFPLEPHRVALMAFPWDCEVPLVQLSREHIVGILRRHLDGELSAEQVAEWADALELRDDVGYVPSDERLLTQTIFELANVEVSGALSASRVHELLARLDAREQPGR